MVAAGFTRAGFVYVGVDDCWQAATRDPAGRLRPDPARFPAGMAALADYVSIARRQGAPRHLSCVYMNVPYAGLRVCIHWRIQDFTKGEGGGHRKTIHDCLHY